MSAVKVKSVYEINGGTRIYLNRILLFFAFFNQIHSQNRIPFIPHVLSCI